MWPIKQHDLPPVVSLTRLKIEGDRAFESLAPRRWNALRNLRVAAYMDIVKKHLKPLFFKKKFVDIL